MEKYTFLREFADSWGLLAMMLFFIGAIVILFRPGAKAMHDDAAGIPLRDDRLDRFTDDSGDQTNKTNGLDSEGAK
jgi:cytochrome c oxidase cbb3-type subunit 4